MTLHKDAGLAKLLQLVLLHASASALFIAHLHMRDHLSSMTNGRKELPLRFSLDASHA